MKREAWILLAGLGLAAASGLMNDYWLGLLTQAVLFGGFALGLDILVGYTGMASLGHAAFFGLSGYGAALAITRWGFDPWSAAAVGLALSLLTALLFAPLAVRMRELAFLTVTLAFGQVMWGLVTRGGNFTGGENGLPGVTRPSLGLEFWDLQTPRGFFLLTVLCVTVITLLVSRFAASPVGLSLLGIRENEIRMAALGYNVQARRAVAFIIAAGVGAVYGVFSAFFNTFVGPSALDWRLSAQILLSVVVGGAGSLWGAFIAGAGLHILKTYLTGETERWVMVLGLLYVMTVVLLPGGLASLPRKLGWLRSAPAKATPPAPEVREP